MDNIQQTASSLPTISNSTSGKTEERGGWSNRSLIASTLFLGGLSAAIYFNRQSPNSLVRSIMSYSVTQIPAFLYLLATEPLDKSDVDYISNKMYQAAKKEVGIKADEAICNIATTAWLVNRHKFILNSDALSQAYSEIRGDGKGHPLLENMVYLKKLGWDSIEIKGSTIFDSRSLTDDPTVPEFKFHAKILNVSMISDQIESSEHSSLSASTETDQMAAKEEFPIDELDIGQALICLLAPRKGSGSDVAHQIIVVKDDDNKYEFYDPELKQSKTVTREEFSKILCIISNYTKKDPILAIKIQHSP